jgi:hypothetical protein
MESGCPVGVLDEAERLQVVRGIRFEARPTPETVHEVGDHAVEARLVARGPVVVLRSERWPEEAQTQGVEPRGVVETVAARLDEERVRGAEPIQHGAVRLAGLGLLRARLVAGAGNEREPRLIELWNEFLYAVVLLTEDEKRTLPLGIMKFMGDQLQDIGMIATGMMISVLPIIAIYVFFSERLIRGMTASVLK